MDHGKMESSTGAHQHERCYPAARFNEGWAANSGNQLSMKNTIILTVHPSWCTSGCWLTLAHGIGLIVMLTFVCRL
jgi:hypothetical protein